MRGSVTGTAFVVAVLCVAGGCARQSYTPRPLDIERAAAAYVERRTDDPRFEAFMRARGHAWPVQHWGLSELTLLAFYYRAELEVARAQAQAARAQADVAALHPPLTVTPRLEHHSADGVQDTPWSLGFEVEIPLLAGTRRAALLEQAEYLAQAAELGVGTEAWRVRSEVRLRLLEVYAERERVASLEREVQQQRTALALLESRRQAGYAAVTEVDTVRLRLVQAVADLAQARTELERAMGGLAQAVALPLERLREMELSFAELEQLPEAPERSSARRGALTNRLDMRRRLLEFAADDAAVKLEVARQYPQLALRPGYLWDQGDNVWSFALDLMLPASLTHAPALRAAEARREAAAQAALLVQATVIGAVDARLAAYQQARVGARAALDASATQAVRDAQIERQFDAGQVDRLELTLARIESILVARRAHAGRVDAQRALGELEDALQAPLAGGPAPSTYPSGGPGTAAR